MHHFCAPQWRSTMNGARGNCRRRRRLSDGQTNKSITLSAVGKAVEEAFIETIIGPIEKQNHFYPHNFLCLPCEPGCSDCTDTSPCLVKFNYRYCQFQFLCQSVVYRQFNFPFHQLPYGRPHHTAAVHPYVHLSRLVRLQVQIQKGEPVQLCLCRFSCRPGANDEPSPLPTLSRSSKWPPPDGSCSRPFSLVPSSSTPP